MVDSKAVVEELEVEPVACCSGKKVKWTWPHQRDIRAKRETLPRAKSGSI